MSTARSRPFSLFGYPCLVESSSSESSSFMFIWYESQSIVHDVVHKLTSNIKPLTGRVHFVVPVSVDSFSLPHSQRADKDDSRNDVSSNSCCTVRGLSYRYVSSSKYTVSFVRRLYGARCQLSSRDRENPSIVRSLMESS